MREQNLEGALQDGMSLDRADGLGFVPYSG